jgi:hypothetical protein
LKYVDVLKPRIYIFFSRDLDHHRSKTTTDQSNTDEQECCNCEIISDSMHSTPKGILCDECFIYWQKSGLMRPELYRSKPAIKKLKRPPKNMSIDLDNLTINENLDPIEQLEEDIRNELSVIQSHNQSIELLTNQSRDGLETMHIPFLINNTNSIETTTSTWSTEEILLAIQAFAKYGKDFPTVSRIIGSTKSIQDVETFFLECRERYQLDTVIDINSKPITNLQQKKADDIVFVN